jgi:multiple sugar transport system substrate-binding protein
MWSGASLAPVNALVKQFNKTHPDIQVSETNIPSVATTSTAKLLSSIAAGDPPDAFTEWWPEIGSFAADGDLISFNKYLTGPLAGFKKYLYPVAVQGGTYKGQLYAVPMSLNSWALYYNKTLLSHPRRRPWRRSTPTSPRCGSPATASSHSSASIRT